MTKRKVVTFAPFIVFATLIAVSLQLNGMLMIWKIQQTKARRYRIDSKNSSLFHLGDNNNNVRRPVSHSLLCRLFFFSQAARGQWAHVFEISPFALRKKKNKKKQTNKQKQGRLPAILWSDWLLWNKNHWTRISQISLAVITPSAYL